MKGPNVGSLSSCHRVLGAYCSRLLEGPEENTTVDDLNPAEPIVRNIPYFPESRALKVMQDLYHQQYYAYSFSDYHLIENPIEALIGALFIPSTVLLIIPDL